MVKNGKKPDPNVIHPIAGYDKEIYVKPTITNSNIMVGDFTYIADSDFESHVTHFYPWSRDKLMMLIAGASHAGKTILAQQMLEKVCGHRCVPVLRAPGEASAAPERRGCGLSCPHENDRLLCRYRFQLYPPVPV